MVGEEWRGERKEGEGRRHHIKHFLMIPFQWNRSSIKIINGNYYHNHNVDDDHNDNYDDHDDNLFLYKKNIS